jgi:hypothetical protein
LLAARSTADTVLHNARTGHPADIADHDYAATYGKLAYRSAFPFDVAVIPGASAGSDDALVAIAEDQRAGSQADPWLAHRNESRTGSAGPRWITTRYALPTRRRTFVRTVVVLIGGVEVRVHGVTATTSSRSRPTARHTPRASGTAGVSSRSARCSASTRQVSPRRDTDG